jgi:hypothetical protein
MTMTRARAMTRRHETNDALSITEKQPKRQTEVRLAVFVAKEGTK